MARIASWFLLTTGLKRRPGRAAAGRSSCSGLLPHVAHRTRVSAIAQSHLPDVGDGDADTAENGGTRLCDLETRREYGIRAGDRHFAGLWRPEPAEGLANAHNL